MSHLNEKFHTHLRPALDLLQEPRRAQRQAPAVLISFAQAKQESPRPEIKSAQKLESLTPIPQKRAPDDQIRGLSRYQLIEIEALVFYTGRELRVSESDVRTELSKALSVNFSAPLSIAQYHKIRAYLWTKLASVL